jgi:predicted ATPase/class 3 adenylate cyclase
MTEQPVGTVTLLFTDIEGSTRLLQHLGTDEYSRALNRHCKLLRAAFAAYGGYEVNWEGDSFFIAFGTADDAVAAALDAQQALSNEDWPGGIDLRVRIGIHTGEPRAAPPKYVGLDVHVAARVMAAAHGGQIVASERTVVALTKRRATLDLGERRLREISDPIRVFQIGHGRFPPLAAPFAATLPVHLSSLVGRDRELGRLAAMIEAGSRLVTITGPGGVGKTRLALAAASAAEPSFPGGVWFVPLEHITSAALMEETIGSAVGAASSLVSRLGAEATLVVLDNLEHLEEASGVVHGLLEQVATLQVLATSRRRLGLRAEAEFLLDPLPLDDGVKLFEERARQVAPELEPGGEVQDLVARLDGLPLAIELAAARAKVLSPREIVARLSARTAPLTASFDDLPARQRTLRATIQWSYDLLPAGAQDAFAKLAAFDGPFRIEEAERVSGSTLDEIAALVDHSLLRRSGRGGQFVTLQTIRDYALELLEGRSDASRVRACHAAWIIDLVGAGQTSLDAGPTDENYFERLEGREPNLRLALAFLGETRPHAFADLVSALFGFWHRRGLRREGYGWTLRALEGVGPRVDLLSAASFFASRGIAFEQAERHARDQLALAMELGDTLGQTNALRLLGLALVSVDEFAEAERCYQRGLELAVRDRFRFEEALCVANIADIALLRGDWQRVVELLAPTIEPLEQIGWTESVIINTYNLALAELNLGRLENARRHAASLLEETSRLEFEEMRALALFATAAVTLEEGEVEAAARLACAAAATLESVEGWVPQLETKLVDRACAAASARFGREHSDRIEQEGRRLTRSVAHAAARAAIS